MYDELQTFFEDPSFENYSTARRAFVNVHSAPQPSQIAAPLQLADLEHLRREEQPHLLREKIDAMPPHWALSPRFHFLAAWAAEQLGDEEDAELERFQTAACLEGLLDSGDGSRQRPYIVSFSEDEHDLLCFLGHTPRSQKLVRDGSTWLDVVDCEDGTQFWFNVSELESGGPHFLQKPRPLAENRIR